MFFAVVSITSLGVCTDWQDSSRHGLCNGTAEHAFAGQANILRSGSRRLLVRSLQWRNVIFDRCIEESMRTACLLTSLEPFLAKPSEACLKMAVFWILAPCTLVGVYQRFRGPCCFHNRGNCRGWNSKTYLPPWEPQILLWGLFLADSRPLSAVA